MAVIAMDLDHVINKIPNEQVIRTMNQGYFHKRLIQCMLQGYAVEESSANFKVTAFGGITTYYARLVKRSVNAEKN
jgi:histidinol phosphatase-like enzyme